MVCDRFTDATYAYQGGGRGIDPDRIALLEEWVQRDLQPDLTVVLDVPVDIGMRRTLDRGETPDRFEVQEIRFKESVRETYLARATAYPQRMKIVDASVAVEDVQASLQQIILSLVDGGSA